MELIEDVLATHTPAQIRMLAFCSAYAGQIVQHSTVKEWRHHRDTFSHLWERVSHHQTLIKPGSPVPCSLAQWKLVEEHLPRATAAWPIYFYLVSIYQSEGEGFFLSRQEIQDAIGTSNASTSKAIRILSPNLISGFFPNGQPMLIAMVNVGNDALWRQRYNARRYAKVYVRSPHGELLSIAHGEQKNFSQKHSLSETSVSRIIKGEPVLGWKVVKPYPVSSVV